MKKLNNNFVKVKTFILQLTSINVEIQKVEQNLRDELAGKKAHFPSFCSNDINSFNVKDVCLNLSMMLKRKGQVILKRCRWNKKQN